MRTRPPRPTRTDTLFPYTTLFRSLDLILNPAALGLVNQPCWRFSIPLPARKPFREAKLRIDGGKPGRPVKDDLLSLLADAHAVLDLAQSNPELSLHQIGKREGRCRTHLARLLRIAWLSPRIVEAIVDGSQPRNCNRQLLLAANLPIEWAEQERLFGFAARSEEHTSELQSLMRISYAVFCLKKKKDTKTKTRQSYTSITTLWYKSLRMNDI